MQIVSTSDCNSRDSYSGRITPAMICAGIYPNGGIDTCQVRLTMTKLSKVVQYSAKRIGLRVRELALAVRGSQG